MLHPNFKNNGKKLKKLGRLIFFSEDSKQPYIAYLEGSNYDNSTKKDYTTLIVKNIDTQKVAKTSLPKNRIKITQQAFFEIGLYPEDLFTHGKIENGIFSINYEYKLNEEQTNTLKDRVIIKLPK